MGKVKSLQQMVLGKLESYIQKKGTSLPPDTTHKSYWKCIKDLNQ